jgi:hypothetical protein
MNMQLSSIASNEASLKNEQTITKPVQQLGDKVDVSIRGNSESNVRVVRRSDLHETGTDIGQNMAIKPLQTNANSAIRCMSNQTQT